MKGGVGAEAMSLLIGGGPVGGGNLTPVRDTLHVGDGAKNEGLIGDVKT